MNKLIWKGTLGIFVLMGTSLGQLETRKDADNGNPITSEKPVPKTPAPKIPVSKTPEPKTPAPKAQVSKIQASKTKITSVPWGDKRRTYFHEKFESKEDLELIVVNDKNKNDSIILEIVVSSGRIDWGKASKQIENIFLKRFCSPDMQKNTCQSFNYQTRIKLETNMKDFEKDVGLFFKKFAIENINDKITADSVIQKMGKEAPLLNQDFGVFLKGIFLKSRIIAILCGKEEHISEERLEIVRANMIKIRSDSESITFVEDPDTRDKRLIGNVETLDVFRGISGCFIVTTFPYDGVTPLKCLSVIMEILKRNPIGSVSENKDNPDFRFECREGTPYLVEFIITTQNPQYEDYTGMLVKLFSHFENYIIKMMNENEYQKLLKDMKEKFREQALKYSNKDVVGLLADNSSSCRSVSNYLDLLYSPEDLKYNVFIEFLREFSNIKRWTIASGTSIDIRKLDKETISEIKSRIDKESGKSQAGSTENSVKEE